LGAGGAADRKVPVGPLEGKSGCPIRDSDRLENIHSRPRIEVMGEERSRRRYLIRPGRAQVRAAIYECRLVRLATRIAGGGKVRRAARYDSIDGLGDDPVLEHRLGELKYIVNNDVGAVVL